MLWPLFLDMVNLDLKICNHSNIFTLVRLSVLSTELQ